MTRRTTPVSTLNIPQQADIDPWLNLKDVKLHDIHASVDLLIGTDAPNVLELRDVDLIYYSRALKSNILCMYSALSLGYLVGQGGVS